MRGLTVIFLLACLFPYTQVLPIETYNQPYALVFGFLLFVVRAPRALEMMPRSDALGLLAFAFIGTTAFIIGCLPMPSAQELKYLLIYISPLTLAVASVAAFHDYPALSRNVVSASAVIWLAVGIVQTVYDPNFAASYVGVWQDAAEVTVESGRGVLGLAPEPTHYGFHLIIMGAILTVLGGSRLLAWSCIGGAVLLARSTSATLALMLGAGIFALQMPFKYKIPILTGIAVSPFVVWALVERFDPEDSRLLYLASAFLREPSAILQIDFSVNVRMGGLIATIRDSFAHFLLPHGLSHASWLEHSREIVARTAWLFELSEPGPPTGFGIVVYQLGFIGALLLIRPISRLIANGITGFDRIVVLAAVWVFVGQYYISTPGYSLLLGGVIWLAMRRRDQQVQQAASPAPSLPQMGLQGGSACGCASC